MACDQPSFSICLEREPGCDDAPHALTALPSCPGVFAFENVDGHTVCLAMTADLRRLVRSRLQPIDHDKEATRRVDYHRLTRRVRALPVGSAFEADWAYLHLARRLVPSAVTALTDRWRGWWVHINPEAAFPRFVKTATPGAPPTGMTGVYLGPVADKHAAGRLIEALQAGFDLCRYHHILIEAPHGKACAYKEMGRCPAPCDGSVSMDQYRSLIDAALKFACNRRTGMDERQAAMQQHATALEFEAAERARRQLADLSPIMKPAFAHVDNLAQFRFAVAAPSERDDCARVFAICGGSILPAADVSHDAPRAVLHDVAACIRARAIEHTIELDAVHVQNMGLVCEHLLRPKARQRRPAVFTRVDQSFDGTALGKLMRAARRAASPSADASEDERGIGEQVIDSL